MPTGSSASHGTEAVYLPAQRILLAGWPFSRHFPDLAPLDQPPASAYHVYRTLNLFIALSPWYLVFQNGQPISGSSACTQHLYGQRDAVKYVQDETVKRMNAGENLDTIAATLELPANLAAIPANAEHRTRVPWLVRAIYHGYMGWFDGSATTLALQGLSETERSARLVQIGNPSIVLKAARDALDEHTLKGARWAVYLTHALVKASPSKDATALYKEALLRVAFSTTSAQERNWLLTEAAAQ